MINWIIIMLTGALVTFFIDDFNRRLTSWTAFIVILLATVYAATTFQINLSHTYDVAGFTLHWAYTPSGAFFFWLVSGLGLLALMYSLRYMEGKARQGYFYSAFLVSLAAMGGVTFSRDLLSFFIFWEIMTWTSFLLAIYNAYYGVETKGIKYIIFSSLGAYAMLTAIVFAYQYYGTLDLAELWKAGAFDFSTHAFIPVLLLFGFAVKAAVMPFHVWAPDIYAKTPMSYTTVLSGAMSKLGILGMLLVLASVFSHGSEGAVYMLRMILGWAGAITAALATVYALKQDDAKYLLAWSSVAQLGYIVAAVSTGTRLGLMSAMYLAVLHAMFKGALFMVAGAVEKQAGTTDFRKVSGLIRRMPVTFFVALVSVISLAGVPPLGGFVGKWLLYEAMITETHSYLLVVVIFFSSTAAFMYAYRFLYGLFLGQQEEEIRRVKEAPALMLIPMLILAAGSLVTGAWPGLIFRPAAKALENLGLPAAGWKMSVLSNAWGNETDVLTTGSVIVFLFVLVTLYITLKGMKSTKRVSTKDISTSGEIPKPDENLSFQYGFFKPFERAASPLYKYSMNAIWENFGEALEAFFAFIRKIYSGNAQTYVLYVILFLVLLLLFKDMIF